MEPSKRHVGRPKTSPQTGPLVLSERRTRTKVEIEIGTEVAEELGEYVRWVEVSEGMSTADARAATVEFALRNVFKRDRMWKDRRRKGEAEETLAATTTLRSAQPATPTPSLPPPSGARSTSHTAAAATR